MKVQTCLRFINGWQTPPPAELDSPTTLVFVFGSPSFRDRPEVFQELKELFPSSKIIGCSSAGEIHGARVFDQSLSIAVAHFEKTQIFTASASLKNSEDSFKVGEQIGRALTEQAQKPIKSVFLLSDGLSVNGSELVHGMNEVLPSSVSITGGLAGDGSDFKSTWILDAQGLRSGAVTAIALCGEALRVSHGSQGGWDYFGPERLITKSDRNVLYELDGKPALEIYKEYLGQRAKDLPAAGLLFPLQIRASREDNRRLVRTILGVNEDDKSMTFAGDVPKGSWAQLMRANFDRLIDGASGAAQSLHQSDQNIQHLTIAISCVGRRLVLGERIEEEVEAILEKRPAKTHQVGFYSYGEISPLVKGDACELHNQTMTLTDWSEDEAA